MTTPNTRQLGYTPEEQASSPYARFFNPDMAPLPEHVREALAVGAVASELLPPIEHAADLLAPGHLPVETGYTRGPGGAAHVAVRSEMPGVSPAMWDWWFAWHGSEDQRYRLWHPRAHVAVAWADGREDLEHYVGRVSQVVEYVGSQCFAVQIAFLPPSALGLDEARLARQGEVAICARIGMRVGGLFFDTGTLLHHLRPIAGGCEMRSRFWIGGRNVALRALPGALGRAIGALAGRLQPPTETQIRELMVHDAQEMNHLAGFLPELYAAFGPQAQQEVAA